MADGGNGGPLRYSVISGPTGRRRWPDEVKARLVAESFAPGVQVVDVARRNGVLPSQLTTWRRRAKDGRLALPWESLGRPEPGFAPLLVEEDPAALTTAPASHEASGGQGRIEIAVGAVVVRLPGDIPVPRLSELVRALAEAAPQ
jgi:transposase